MTKLIVVFMRMHIKNPPPPQKKMCASAVLCLELSSIHLRVAVSSVKFTLELVTKAQRGSRGIARLILNLCASWGWVVNATPRPLLLPGKGPVPIVQEAGWAPRPVWTGAENLPSHRHSIPGPSRL
jgi:hypothetical protein